MSHQSFFVWPHGGKSVSLAGAFNHWNPQPLHKQGNYFFGVLDLPDGVYSYKFVVDGRWVYDISQIHADDGSGNWNNEIEVGRAAVVHKEPSSQPVPKQQQHKEQQAERQQKGGEQQQKGGEQQQQKTKKQLRIEQQQKQQAERQQKGGEQQQKGGKQQQKGKKNEPPPEPEPQPQPEPEPQPESEPQPEPQPEPELVPQPEEFLPESEAQQEAELEAEVQPEAEVEVEAEAVDETPQPPQKVLISILTIEVVGQSEVNMEEVEKFVRSVQRPGLKWEGSAIKDHVFGLQKLEIICQARDDVAIEGDVLKELESNEDLVASAQITNFAC